jgi:hypothetical protein
MRKTPEDLLQAGGRDLDFVISKVKRLSEIQSLIAKYMDPTLMKYCQVGNMLDHRLTLIVANGTIATQIRFLSNELLKKFKQDTQLQTIQHIDCKVRPTQSSTARMETKKDKYAPLLSNDSAAVVNEIAETITDPKLKQIMQRIAQRKKNGST